MGFSKDESMKIWAVAKEMRGKLIQKYKGRYNSNVSECMMGKCIEATDTLVEKYRMMGYRATAKQVWCLYEYFESCSNYCFEEHWLVELIKGKDKYFIDVTLDQFQWAFSKKLKEVYMAPKLPKFLLTRKPGKTVLDRCGWNDWYNYGDYVNNFEYY